MEPTDKSFLYNFIFPDGGSKSFLIVLDANALYRGTGESATSDWTLLSHNRCPNCRLQGDENSHCPVAVNIASLAAAFQDMASHDNCTVSCVSDDRTVSKQTDVQDGLRSIMGIIMATSGCPALDILRPMAWFHLPFGNVDESVFRSTSTYLLRQYFQAQAGTVPDFSMDRIKEYYLYVEEVNRGMLMRVRDATTLDADRNAIIILNNLAQILGMEVDARLERLRPLFT